MDFREAARRVNGSPDNQLSVKGAWWDIATPDQRHFGELRVSGDGEITLGMESVAFRSKEEVAGLTGEPIESCTYHGHDQHGRPHTLFGCVRANTHSSVAYVRRRRSVAVLVRGLHAPTPDDVTFDNVTVDFTHLQEWLCTPRLRRGRAEVDQIVMPKPSEAEQAHTTAEGFDIVIRPFLGGSSSAKGELFSFEHCFDLRFAEPVSLRRLMDLVGDIQWFLTLGVGDPVGVLSVKGSRKGVVIPGTDFPESIEVFQHWRGSPERPRDIYRFDMLYTAEDLAGGIGAALDRWRGYRAKHHAVLACYFSTIFNRHLYSNHHFLFLAHALELYHQLNVDGYYQSPADFAARIDRIAAFVPTKEEAEWLRARLGGANKKTLADRLDDLLSKNAGILDGFIANPQQFVARVRDTRNYYTHYDEGLRRNGRVAEGIELLRLTQMMRCVLEAFFLNDLGAPAVAIKKVLRDDRVYTPSPFAITMTPAQIQIIDRDHAQKHHNSCAASLCEMMLKVAGAIAPKCFDLQTAHPDGRDGVSKFVDQPLPGGFTLRKIVQRRPWEFPFDALRAKLAAGIPTGLYLNDGTAHGWLVMEVLTDPRGEESIRLMSKPSEMGRGEGRFTIYKVVSRTKAASLRCSDPVFLEKLAPAPATIAPNAM